MLIKVKLRALRNWLDKYKILPSFDEDTVFLMIVSLIIIYFFVDASVKYEIMTILAWSKKAILIVIAGIAFTIYTTFLKRFRTETQKHYMLWFALIINVVIGITAFLDIKVQNTSPLFFIFPALNIATFFMILIFWYVDLYTTDRLATRSSGYSNIIYGSIIVALITLIYRSIPNTGWQIIFSTSVAYATLFNRKIVQYLPQFFSRKESKIQITQSLIETAIENSLSIINTTGLEAGDIIINTKNHKELRKTSSSVIENAQEKYILELEKRNYSEEDVAIVSLGSYIIRRTIFDWNIFGKNKKEPKKIDDCLLIDVFLANEKRGHQFIRIIHNPKGLYEVGEKGLMYYKSFQWG